MATGCNRNEGREERGHFEIGETACQHLHFVRSQLLLLCVSLCAISPPSPSFMQGMLILCLAVGKMDISYPPSFPMELPDSLKDFLAK